MKRVVRVLIHEGPAEWVDDTIERSLKGVYQCGAGKTITSFAPITQEYEWKNGPWFVNDPVPGDGPKT